MVMLFHYTPVSGPLAALAPVLQAGWVGVDLFFVLSGYLIAGILLDTAGGPHYYRNFIVRRCLRIFPLYYACLVLYAFVTYIPYPVNWKDYWEAARMYVLYLGNFKVFAENKWPAVAVMTPLWSLQIEEQFYLLFPLLVWALKRRTLGLTLCGALAAAPLLRIALVLAMPANIAGTYVLAPCRMDALAFGALIAVAAREWPDALRARWIGWAAAASAAVCVSILAFVANSPWSAPMRTVGFSALDAAFAGVVARLAVAKAPALGRVLRVRALVWVGTVSYGLYLSHIPAPAVAHWVVDKFAKIPVRSSTDLLVSFPAAFLAAWVSWKVFESPVLRLKDRFTSNRR